MSKVSSWFTIRDTRNIAALRPRTPIASKEPPVNDGPIDFVNPDLTWRRLALQFDGHRMQAIGHLKCMLQDPVAHREEAEKFLKAGPLSGEKVLENRLKAIVVGIVQDDVVKLLDKL